MGDFNLSIENNYCKLQQAHDKKCRVLLRFHKTNGQITEMIGYVTAVVPKAIAFLAITGNRHLIQLDQVIEVNLQSGDRRYVV
ncbi:hypothetical protein RXV91_09650 [Lactiplantibacillus sp. DA1]|uniref:hypothetical protein n=1 Tax=Lactiplantibacillus sp. DA1 TaxID=3079857 RepID=UPI00292A6503|nr:hypothetical protein [Lactiplantibacillus sp. DA1]MDV0431134.1 hypothetical protein [Lactiplantibacillus sp. DA1]